MVARVKSTRFGCMLAASLLVLVLAGCADVSESSSSQKAQPSKKGNPPRQQRATLLEVSLPTANPPNPTCSDLSTSQAPVRTSIGSGYVLSGTVPPRSASRSPMPGSSSGWPTLGGTTTTHTGPRCLLARGRYRFESNVPVSYGGRPPHIHVRVRAPGYEELITQHYPERGQRKANFDLVLLAQ